jgi:hypothetical protein
MIVMTTGFDEFDNRIHDLVENLPPLQQMRQTGELDISFQSAAHLSSSG